MSDFVKILFFDGPDACHDAMMERLPGSGKAEAFRMRKSEESLKAGWKKYKDEILRIWKSEKRRGKSWAERIFDNE